MTKISRSFGRHLPPVAILVLLFILWGRYNSELLLRLLYDPNSQSSQESFGLTAHKSYSRTMVIASTISEDTSWVAQDFPDVQHAIYVADDPSSPFHPPRNKGRESTIYLSYIIDHYHNLSDITIFSHAQTDAWHNNDLFDHNLSQMIASLSDDHVIRSGFFNLRCHPESGCPDHIHTDSEDQDMQQMEEIYFKKVWNDLHGPDVPLPEVLGAPCCSQFAASREQLQSISLQRWEKYREWLLDTELSDDISGRIWEFTWHFILLREAVHCPSIESCYCDGYGLCFESAAEIHIWLAMQEISTLSEEVKKDFTNRGADHGTIEYRMGQKISRPMKKWWHEAELRGRDPETRARLSGRPWKKGDGY